MILTIESQGIFQVTGDTPAVIEEDLNTALDAALDQALREGRSGLLVTRHSPDRYTVIVSSDVPYGQTQEHDSWEKYATAFP
ncbi:MAG TPA: hypothetical protein VIG41_00510 [Micrococcaceae bacterium]|jgi:hypothetical protein|nr:hypothetical protein [Micrococcaceae bacterium]